MGENIHEECGVFGVFADKQFDAANYCYYGLFALQHRGQESCGIVVNDDGVFNAHIDKGIVDDVFTSRVMESFDNGRMAIAHVRYGTKETAGRRDAQPIVISHHKGNIALCYNGAINNAYELRIEMEETGSMFHTNSEAEIITNVIAKERLTSPSTEEAVYRAMDKIKGAYCVVMMSPTKMIAFRDEHGFHPLCYGITDDGVYVVASETCALDAVGARLIRDVRPGEILVFEKNGVRSITGHCGKSPRALCIFEYIYLARPDSFIEGCSVHKARRKAGEMLAKIFPVDADVVIGVPDSGLDAAIGYAKESGIPYGLGFVKNKYIGRTFIVPGQHLREDRVKIKLNPIADTVEGKRIVLIDDSIVRGTTSTRIVRMLREAGAKEVHMRVSAPLFVNQCFYGTDIESREALIANRFPIEQIPEVIGVDSLGFLPLENVRDIVVDGDNKGFCTACFDGKNPTEIDQTARSFKYSKKIKQGDD